MKYKIVLLPGDGIGPEIVDTTVDVLNQVATTFGHEFVYQTALIGGCAIDAEGTALSAETLELCRDSDAVLLGAVGGPKWDDPRAAVRPEQGLLGLRKGLGLYANLRPVKSWPDLRHVSPLRPELLDGVDLLVVRELTGGIYFGEPRFREMVDGVERAVDTMAYTTPEIERVVRLACRLAQGRRKKVTSVDKANVLEVMRLWRETATRTAAEYEDIEFETILVDACAMYLIKQPAYFDVLVMGNMFGDILTDEASMIAGSMGLLPSASIGDGTLGVFEPIHGSAPKYTGMNVVNPLATILSAAMLLRYSLKLEREAAAVEKAVESLLADGYRTRDIMSEGKTQVGTRKVGELVAERVRAA